MMGVLCEHRRNSAIPLTNTAAALAQHISPDGSDRLLQKRSSSTVCSSSASSTATTSTTKRMKEQFLRHNSDTEVAAVAAASAHDDAEEYTYVYTEKMVIIDAENAEYEYEDSPKACLGTGSYGTVFKGVRIEHDDKPETTGRESVAIKKIARDRVKPGELRALKKVRNAHLVCLIDICEQTVTAIDDFTYLVMELMDTDLDQHLKWSTSFGRLTPTDLETICRSLAIGYFALFEQRVVHRDIKPQNILLNYDRTSGAIATAKITDFGVSRVLDDEEDLCHVVGLAGTFYYMAPEVGANVVRAQSYDHSVDMWSIGCVLFQCLTGELPFDECSICKLFLYCACSNYEAYDPPAIPEDTEGAIRDMLIELLEIDPDKRASPADFYEAVTKSTPPMAAPAARAEA